MKTWPAPLLQPDPHTGCMEYSVAYLCHCLGYPDVTPAAIATFYAQEHYAEEAYPARKLGLEMRRWWDDKDDEAMRRRWWLGPTLRPWVEDWFARGYVALWRVWHVPTLSHMIVGLEARGNDGVLVMDPLFGFVIKPWEWMLGLGPDRPPATGLPCHRIDGWYRNDPAKDTAHALN